MRKKERAKGAFPHFLRRAADKSPLYARKILFYVREKIIDFLYKRVRVGAVNSAGIAYAFTSGMRATEAVHAYFKEKLSRFRIEIENIADKSIFCNLHFIFLR